MWDVIVTENGIGWLSSVTVTVSISLFLLFPFVNTVLMMNADLRSLVLAPYLFLGSSRAVRRL